MKNELTSQFLKSKMSLQAQACKHGKFEFVQGASLKAESRNVCDGYGIYLIYGHYNEHEQLLYIGKSGTVSQDGTMGDQGLRGRLNNKQEGKPRKQYFERLVSAQDERVGPLEKLCIEWFETYLVKGEGREGAPPFLVEAQLLSAYLADNETLPPLNKKA